MNSMPKPDISDCLNQIEAQVGWGPSRDWKQRDFEQLSELIFEKTGTRLSLSTLKRIFAQQYAGTPQPATLNALAQFAGFKSWTEFRSFSASVKRSDQTISDNTSAFPEKWKIRKRLSLLIIIILFATLAVFVFPGIKTMKKLPVNQTEEREPEIKFSYKILSDGLPNTVVFSFDLSSIKGDSIYFQQTWNDKTKVPVPAGSKNFSSIYYYPGYHTAKLFAGKNQIAEQKVHVVTDGWIGLVTNGTDQTAPLYLKNPVNNGMLYAPPESFAANKNFADKFYYYVRYYNTTDFGELTGDNFTFTARVRNDIEHGGATCQDVRFYITCESGMIIVPFCMPGCVGNLNVVSGDNFLAGRNNDLSSLGINLSEWQSVQITSSGKAIEVKTSAGDLKIPYKMSLGALKGLMIEFKGTGAIDDIYLGTDGKKDRFKWTFN